MRREDFDKVVEPGDLILVTTYAEGKYIDRFNSNITEVGIYKPISEDSFCLCGIIADGLPISTNHSAMYGTIKTVVLLKSKNDILRIIEKSLRKTN